MSGRPPKLTPFPTRPPSGPAGVVGVGVREHDRLDVADREADRRQVALEAPAEAGEARVDRGEPPRLLDEVPRSEEHTSELQSRQYLVCRLLLEKKKKPNNLI